MKTTATQDTLEGEARKISCPYKIRILKKFRGSHN